MGTDDHTGILNKDEEDEIRLCGYAHSLTKQILFYFLILLSGGTVLLISCWKPHLRLSLTARRCELRSADFIIVYVSQIRCVAACSSPFSSGQVW